MVPNAAWGSILAEQDCLSVPVHGGAAVKTNLRSKFTAEGGGLDSIGARVHRLDGAILIRFYLQEIRHLDASKCLLLSTYHFLQKGTCICQW